MRASKAPIVLVPNYSIVYQNVLMIQKRPPFNDLRLREAVNLALDRRDWLKAITLNEGLLGGPMAPAPNADSAAKVYAAKMNAATQGAGLVGGAKGAAAGTAIGAIAGNTGEGAAIGAVLGGLAGRRARKEAEQEAQVAGAQAAQNKEKQNMATFTRAMTACLTGKGYSVN